MGLPLIPIASMLIDSRALLSLHGFHQPSRSVVAVCPDLKRIDYRALRRGAAKLATWGVAEVPAHFRVRGPFPLPRTTEADFVLSTVAGKSITQDQPTQTSSVVWRNAKSQWMMDRVDFIDPINLTVAPGSVSPTQEQLDLLQRRHTAGLLAPDQAASLEAALSNRCFAAEPAWLELPIPAIHDGGPPYIEGYPGAGGLVAFQHKGRLWYMYHEAPRAQFKAILDAVLYARPAR